MVRTNRRIPQYPLARARSAPHGFTLIELLVVVSIIALLVAILLPSLQAARRQAKVTVCMTNLHGIGVAMWAYSEDNRQFLPQKELLGNHVYRAIAGLKMDMTGPSGYGVVEGRYPECFGISYILDQGSHVKLGAEGQPPPSPPDNFVSKNVYYPASSKGWLCPANAQMQAKAGGLKKWGEYGCTYMFSLAMGGTLSSPAPIDRLKPSHNLLQDNSQFIPPPTGYNGPFSQYFVNSSCQVPPHRLSGRRDAANRAYVELHVDMRAELHAWSPY
ncbi:MAG: prepilin-type N-terminal cleavage/methylation domain-containing protein [Phycisphaerae bacterium]|nr:prepilin-type N-terminal cleavage/methylation domain-containing protein [Phycisphaerae bacterium]